MITLYPNYSITGQTVDFTSVHGQDLMLSTKSVSHRRSLLKELAVLRRLYQRKVEWKDKKLWSKQSPFNSLIKIEKTWTVAEVSTRKH